MDRANCTFRSLALSKQIFATKSIDKLIRESEDPQRSLKKTLGPVSLTALGIGAVIGSGIFTVIGTAIAGQNYSGTSVLNTPVLDFLVHHSALAGRPGAERSRSWVQTGRNRAARDSKYLAVGGL